MGFFKSFLIFFWVGEIGKCPTTWAIAQAPLHFFFTNFFSLLNWNDHFLWKWKHFFTNRKLCQPPPPPSVSIYLIMTLCNTLPLRNHKKASQQRICRPRTKIVAG
jgi:hypothetical protein